MIAREEKPKPFEQQTKRVETPYSINIPIRFSNVETTFLSTIGLGPKEKGWVNLPNPFRGILVMGVPGSGKSSSVIKSIIRQHIEKGFALFIYDFKSPDLTRYAYAQFLKNNHVYQEKYGVKVEFHTVSFDDPRYSLRVNPLAPELITDIADAQEAARTILLNLNRTWVEKEGNFFVESAINLLTACIWHLKKFREKTRDPEKFQQIRLELGLADEDTFECCTFPHLIEFVSRDYKEILPLLLSEPELESITRPFARALEEKAFEELEGLFLSARISMSSLLKQDGMYWVMSGNELDFAINKPRAGAKIVCVSNNLEKQQTYSAGVGLINGQLTKGINHRGRWTTSIIIDELPTTYLRGLDTLIATARSKKISTTFSVMDYTQLGRDYGEKYAETIFNTIGNIVSGQVLSETAKRVSIRVNGLINEAQIEMLAPGEFVGKISDNFGEDTGRNVFYGHLEGTAYDEGEDLPVLPQWQDVNDEKMNTLLAENVTRIALAVEYIIGTQSIGI